MSLSARWRRVQPLMAFVARHLDDDLSLAALARRARVSRFHLRRGSRTLASAADLTRHAAWIARAGPCIGLFQAAQHQTHGERSMPYSITQKELTPQQVLVVRRRVRRSDIASTLAEQLGRIFQQVQSGGGAIAGQPFTRYLEWGPGVLTLEIGLPIAAQWKQTSGDIRADTLPGGPVATTTHMGAYEKLHEAHAAVQVWMEERSLRGAGAPWEVYVSDPAEVPDPANWRTDIFWPLER